MPEPTATISVPSEDPKKPEKKTGDSTDDASKKKDDAKVGEDLVSVECRFVIRSVSNTSG